MTTKFGEMKDTFTTAWAAILASLRSGDMQQAAKIGMAGLNLASLQATSDSLTTWRNFSTDLQTVWIDLEESWAQFSAFMGRKPSSKGPIGDLINPETAHKEMEDEAVKINQGFEERRNKLRKANDDALNKSFTDLQDAKNKLNNVIANTEPPLKTMFKHLIGKPEVWDEAVKALPALGVGSSRGTFNSFAANALSGSDKLIDILSEHKKGNKHLKHIADRLDELDELND